MSSGYRHQSFKDGLLEVVGIFSSFHVAQLQMGLSSPVRLGQGKTVEVREGVKNFINSFANNVFLGEIEKEGPCADRR